jgi:hypothetical protein
LPPDLIRTARKVATERGMTLSMFVNLLLLQRLNGAAEQ